MKLRAFNNSGWAKALRRLDPSTPLFRVRDLPLVLVFLPAALGFLYVAAFGVDVPFGDTWIMVDRFEKLSEGTLTFNDLWAQHYEHRLLFPKLALLLVGAATSFDNVAALYLTQGLFLVTLVTLLVAFRNGVSRNLLLFVPIAFLVFSLRQWFNMFSAIQIAFAFAQAFAVLAFYLLHVSRHAGVARRLAFPAALVSGAVSSYSLLVGLFVWPVGLLQLLVSPAERRAKRVMLAAWTLVGAGVWVVYFLGLEMGSSERESELYFFNNPSLGLDYFATAFGSPLYWTPGPALVLGAVATAITMATLFFVYRAKKFGECAFWLALAAFALACLAAMTAGRAGGGIDNALQSRYITFTNLAYVGVYATLLKLALERTSAEGSFARISHAVAISLGVLSVLILVSVPLSYYFGLKKGRMVEAQRTRAYTALSTYGRQPDGRLDNLHRPPEVIREKSYVLCKLGYSLFSDPRRQASGCLPPPLSALSPADSPALAAIDNVAGRRPERGRPVVVDSEEVSSVQISGWAVDGTAERLAGGVFVRVDDEFFPAFYGDKRPGVAQRLSEPAYELSGFERTIPVREIGGGEHELSVVVVGGDRRTYQLWEGDLTLEVR